MIFPYLIITQTLLIQQQKLNKPTFVVVNVFDILGRNIQTLISDYLQPGLKTISWDGRNYNGEDMGAGMYFYQLKANGTTLTKKMVLLK